MNAAKKMASGLALAAILATPTLADPDDDNLVINGGVINVTAARDGNAGQVNINAARRVLV